MSFCNFCKKNFSCKGTLARHQRTARFCQSNQKDVYECEYCEQKFTQKTSLSSHLDRCPVKITTRVQEKYEKYEREMHLLRKENRRVKTDSIEQTEKLQEKYKKSKCDSEIDHNKQAEKITNLKQIIKEKDGEITNLKTMPAKVKKISTREEKLHMLNQTKNK